MEIDEERSWTDKGSVGGYGKYKETGEKCERARKR